MLGLGRVGVGPVVVVVGFGVVVVGSVMVVATHDCQSTNCCLTTFPNGLAL